MKKIIIVDIDGTLANCDHRLPYITHQRPKDWKKFHSLVSKDKVNKWCSEIVQLFQLHYGVVLVSGRVLESRKDTEEWLEENKIHYDSLYMRETIGDHRDDDILKKELYEKYIKGKYEVLFVLDDRKRVVDMWRSLGITCLQSVDGDF